MKITTPNRSAIGIALSCILIGVLAGLGVQAYRAMTHAPLSTIGSCMQASSDPTAMARCLHTAIPLVLKSHSTQEVMTYIVASSTPSAVVEQCHAIGHMVGEYSYEQNHSLEATLSQCTNSCRYGCKHGAIAAAVLNEMGIAYDEEDIAHADLSTFTKLSSRYCRSNESTCHGVGHLAYVLTGNAASSTALCDTATKSPRLREGCYQGVFMERSGTFDNMLYPGTEVTPTYKLGEYTYPCTSIATPYRHACFLFLNGFQLPLFANDGYDTEEKKLAKAISVCETLSGRDRANCFEGIGGSSVTFGYKKVSAKDLQPFCDLMPTDTDRNACILGVIPQFFFGHENQLFPYCSRITQTESRRVCYNAVFQWIEVREGFESDPERMCADNAACRTLYDSFTQTRDTTPNYRFGLFGK